MCPPARGVTATQLAPRSRWPWNRAVCPGLRGRCGQADRWARQLGHADSAVTRLCWKAGHGPAGARLLGWASHLGL